LDVVSEKPLFPGIANFLLSATISSSLHFIIPGFGSEVIKFQRTDPYRNTLPEGK